MKPIRFLLFAFAAVLMASCAKEPLGQNIPSDGGNVNEDYVAKGWVRIRLADDAQLLKVGAFTRGAAESGDPDIDRLAADLGATEIRRVFRDDPRFEERHRRHGLHLWFDVKFDESIPVSRAQNQFASLPEISHAQPIYKIVATDGADYIMPAKDGYTTSRAEAGNQRQMPFDDPDLPLQWHYDNDGSIKNSIAGADINLFEAWAKFGAGDPSVIVCVMDSGVDNRHPDLHPNMWVNEAELNGTPGVDDDGNGYVDDVYGYNFDEDTAVYDFGEHGTHVAGTIAAVNNNGIGVCGIAGGTGNGDGVRIMSTQIYDSTGLAGDNTPDYYVYAADNGAVISQNSWNFPNKVGNPVPQDYATAFDYFIDNAGTDNAGNQTGPMKGGVIFFSAGNNYSFAVGCPGNYSRNISVSAMIPNYQKASYSNIGADVGIFAPGGAGAQDTAFGDEGKVYSTILDGGYGYKSGTSMACPHVSGVAAIIVSYYGAKTPGFTNTQLKDILLRSVRNVSAYQSNETVSSGLGAGLLDAALIDLHNPGEAPAKPETVTVSADKNAEKLLKVVIKVPADGNNMYVTGFNIFYAKQSDYSDQSAWTKIYLKNNMAIGATREYTISKGLEDATTYVFRVSAVDRFGNESGYAEATCKTIDHINRPPTSLKSIDPITLPFASNGEKVFVRTLELDEYFTDPDFPNDELSYTVTSDDTAVVKAMVVGNKLTIEGLEKSAKMVAVSLVVSDRFGAKITRGIAVTVTESPNQEPSEPEKPEPDKKPLLREGELNLYPNPVIDVVNIGVKGAGSASAELVIYDSAGRVVVSDGSSVLTEDRLEKYDLGRLKPGVYTMTLSIGGKEYKNTFVKK